jgi:hypothetical protein
MSHPIRYARLDGFGDDCVDRDNCLRVLVGPRILPGNGLSPIDQTTLRVYYFIPDVPDEPDGRWICDLAGSRRARLPAEGYGEGYIQVHPVVVTRDRLLCGMDLPPQLERYRELASEGFDEWVRSQEGGMLGSAEARKATLERHRKASQSGPAAGMTDLSGDPATPRPGTPLATSEPKVTPGTPERRRGLKRKALTAREDKVWTVYEKHEGRRNPFYDVVGVLKAQFPTLEHKEVERIVRKVKARRDRDKKASPGIVTKTHVKRSVKS